MGRKHLALSCYSKVATRGSPESLRKLQRPLDRLEARLPAKVRLRHRDVQRRLLLCPSRLNRTCPRSESNRHASQGGGFSCHFGFRRPGAPCVTGFVVWSTPSPWPC